jgi:hypothetical protein
MTELQKRRGAGTGATLIKEIWKFASIMWRRGNRKNMKKFPKKEHPNKRNNTTNK